jgi:ABC-2 type transport system ATP-binding protein
MLEYADQRLGEYSKGMRQKIGLIRAMLHNPSVLLLDEPTSAMDPHSAKNVRDAITELRNEKRAIVLCTHNLSEAELLADRIAIISRGRIITQGDPEDLKRQLLGRRLFEIKLDQSIDGHSTVLEEIIHIEAQNNNTLSYRTDDPDIINPQLVRLLTGRGLGIISLQERSATLEQVYLQVVEAEMNEKTANDKTSKESASR